MGFLCMCDGQQSQPLHPLGGLPKPVCKCSTVACSIKAEVGSKVSKVVNHFDGDGWLCCVSGVGVVVLVVVVAMP